MRLHLAALLLVGSAAAAEPPFVDADTPVVFDGVTVITMLGDQVLGGQRVLIEDGVIAAIGAPGAITIPPSAEVIDGTGRYLMPGLNDMHTHLGGEVTVRGGIGERQLTVYLANGVTTILNLGDFETLANNPVIGLGERVRAGEIAGPTVYTAAFARGPADGGTSRQVFTSYEDGRAYAADAYDAGFDFIKVYNDTRLAAFQGIMDEADARGRSVIGHFPVPVGWSQALTSGMDMVAHNGAYRWSFFGGRRDASLIARAISETTAADAWLNTTLAIDETIADVWGGDFAAFERFIAQPEMRYAHPEEILVWKRGVAGTRWNPAGSSPGQLDEPLAFQRQYLLSFHDAGIPLVLGTDSPTVLGAPGFSAHDELFALERIGLTVLEVLTIATRNGGEFMAAESTVSERFGTVEIGSRADLILLESDPLADLGNLEDRVGVMARGRWYSAVELQSRIDAIAAEYDGFRDATLARVSYPGAGGGGGGGGGSGGGGAMLLILPVLIMRLRR